MSACLYRRFVNYSISCTLMVCAGPVLAGNVLWSTDKAAEINDNVITFGDAPKHVYGAELELNAVGGPIVIGERKVTALDAKTGEVKWTRGNTSYMPVPGTAIAVSQNLQNMEMFDVDSGKVILSISDKKPYGGLNNFFAYLPVQQLNMMLLFGYEDDVSNRGATVLAVEMTSGKVLWKSGKILLNAQSTFVCPTKPKHECGISLTLSLDDTVALDVLQPPIVDSTGMVLYLDGAGPVKIDPKTGNIIWRAAQQKQQTDLFGNVVQNPRPPYFGNPDWVLNGSSPMFAKDGLLFVPNGYHLYAFDMATGVKKWVTQDPGGWQNKKRYSTSIRGVYSLDGVLVVYGSSIKEGKEDNFWVDLVEPATGKTYWEVPNVIIPEGRKAKPHLVSVSDRSIYLANEDSLTIVSLETGKSRDVAIKLKSNDKANKLEFIDGNILVSSSDAIMLLDKQGKEIYSKSYPAPQMSEEERLKKQASSWLMAEFKKGVYSTIAKHSSTDAGMAAAIAYNGVDAQYQKQLADTYKVNSVNLAFSRQYAYFYTYGTTGGKNELVQVKKSDGAEVLRIPLSTSISAPSYAVDYGLKQIYIRQSNGEVVAEKI